MPSTSSSAGHPGLLRIEPHLVQGLRLGWGLPCPPKSPEWPGSQCLLCILASLRFFPQGHCPLCGNSHGWWLGFEEFIDDYILCGSNCCIFMWGFKEFQKRHRGWISKSFIAIYLHVYLVKLIQFFFFFFKKSPRGRGTGLYSTRPSRARGRCRAGEQMWGQQEESLPQSQNPGAGVAKASRTLPALR